MPALTIACRAPPQHIALKRKRSSLTRSSSHSRGVAMENPSQLADRILEQVADAMIYADRSGAIIRWNQASAALFGYSADEALGQSLDLIIPEHLRTAHWGGFETAMTRGVMKLQGRPT